MRKDIRIYGGLFCLFMVLAIVLFVQNWAIVQNYSLLIGTWWFGKFWMLLLFFWVVMGILIMLCINALFAGLKKTDLSRFDLEESS